MRNWCCRMHLDSWESLVDDLDGWHPCLQKQKDAGMAHGGLRVSCEVQEEEVWPPSLPNCNSFCYFVWGESEVWVIEKSRNKTKDLIQKMKEVLGSFNRDTTVVKACKSLRSRI
jgi:hypothetical protein